MAKYIAKNISLHEVLNYANLPLRGHVEKLALKNGTNVGNLLSLPRLVAQFDPRLGNHMRHATEIPKTISYLSPQIILVSTVRLQVTKYNKRNNGILLDSTPDISHRE